MTPSLTNRLSESISPYLLAHADNPVAWQPWDAAALAAARDAGCPILLSIGYSACHWCHVMAHESFADEATAELMNRHFVNIKVDREERPDLDRVYQLAHQALTGRGGGWPLTIFLAPDDLMPFFAGTYFPARAFHGMPPFTEVLERVAQAWRDQREAIRSQNAELGRLFASIEPAGGPGALTEEPVRSAVGEMEHALDEANGGFGDAPKFPHPGPLVLALERWAADDRAEPARRIVERTLDAMQRGGICDQVGGGFARYSVDTRWEIPHFEKMLYDNAALLPLYADAAAAFGREDFAATARATAGWVLAEMRRPEGGFCASLDADSPGGEGRFYVWDRDEVRAVVGDDDWPLVRRYWGFDRAPNFEGRWHPVVALDTAALAAEHGIDEADARARIERARVALKGARDTRERPARDDKVLTAWNAAMAGGLARAGLRLGEPRYVEAALEAVDFMRGHLWHDGRLHAVWRDGELRQPAFLDDHAAWLCALLEVLQARWRDDDLELARTVAEAIMAHFHDPERGGFYQTGDDHEPLPYRPRPFADESTPGGNALAALGLQGLGELVGEPRYLEAARGTVGAAMAALERDPLAHATLVRALARQFRPDTIVVVHGDATVAGACAQQAARTYQPQRLVFTVPADAGAGLGRLPEPAEGDIVARRCQGSRCEAPVTGQAAVTAMLAERA